MPSAALRAQFVLGSDYVTASAFADPANWTRAILDTATNGTTITFKLNPCQWVLYFDEDGQPKSCMPEPICGELEDMGDILDGALDVWGTLANDALTLEWEDLATCPQSAENCPSADAWADDGDWVVTRTYDVAGNPVDCTDADTGALSGGAGFRVYTDPTGNHDERWVRECDVVFFEDHWDGSGDSECINAGYSPTQCGGAWRMALAHEIGHCLGFGHTYMTRRLLEPLEGELSITLDEGISSIMSYDRPGSVEAWGNGLGPYDRALYLETYATSPPTQDYFTAYGTVTDCATSDPVVGAAVIALQEATTEWVPVHMSLSGIDPLDEATGEFSLPQLARNNDYRLLVVDARDPNQLDMAGWKFDDVNQSDPPKIHVFRAGPKCLALRSGVGEQLVDPLEIPWQRPDIGWQKTVPHLLAHDANVLPARAA